MKKFTFLLCAILLSFIGYAQNSETFTNLDNASGGGNGISSSYQTWTWIGDNGATWVATDARKDQNIDGEAITIRDGSLTTTISGGIGNLTLTTQRKFSGGSGNLTVLANGDAVGTFAYGTSEQSNTITGINLSGVVALEIQNTGGDRVAMDNLIWTSPNDGSDYDCQSSQANIGDSCDDGNPLTNNDTINEDCECVGIPVDIGNLCGFENFENANLTASYRDGSFVGNDNITWTYVESRDENGDQNNSGIEGNAIMLRRESDGSKITSNTISGGISNFSVKLYKGFTGGGDRQVELFINGVSHETSTPFNDYDEHIFTVDDIDLAGDFTLEIRNITGKQIIIDDISWTCFEDEGGETYDCSDLQANIGDSCDDGDEMTENDIVTEDCECMGTPIIVEPEFDCPSLQANIGDSCDDGDDSTENDVVNEDCECMGTPIIVEPEFDCPSLQANFGDSCDDGDDTTENDIITEDCECMGTPIVVEPEECDIPYGVALNRISPTSATFVAGNSQWHYQGSANRAGRPLRPYPMYGMNDMTVPHTQYALVPAFDYDVWIRTICQDGSFSPWAGPFYLPTYEDASRRTPGMILSPNPAVATVSISKVNARTIEVFDMNGSHIKTFNTKDSQFDVTGLPTGKYNLRIIDVDGNAHYDQIIKK